MALQLCQRSLSHLRESVFGLPHLPVLGVGPRSSHARQCPPKWGLKTPQSPSNSFSPVGTTSCSGADKRCPVIRVYVVLFSQDSKTLSSKAKLLTALCCFRTLTGLPAVSEEQASQPYMLTQSLSFVLKPSTLGVGPAGQMCA